MHLLLNFLFLSVFCTSFFLQVTAKVDLKVVRCEVCKVVVNEMEEAVAKVDPKRVIKKNTFYMDPDGNPVIKTVQYSKSGIFITELMEQVCDKMEDYAKVIYRKTGKVSFLKFMINGVQNPAIGDGDFLSEIAVHKSLKAHCLELLEDQEEPFLSAFMNTNQQEDISVEICWNISGYCKIDSSKDDGNKIEL